jgi:hypothetical protein
MSYDRYRDSDERHAGEALRNISQSLPHEGRLPQL